MKLRYVMILLWIVVSSPLQGEEERHNHGRVWSNWTDLHRYIYLSGFKDGMGEGWTDLERFIHKTFQIDWTPYMDRYTDFYRYSLSKNFPDLAEVRDVMTDFYTDPSNAYLEPTTILLASVAKLRGASPGTLEKLLVTAREKADQLYTMRKKETVGTQDVMEYIKGPSFSSMIYEEIYGGKE
jgi:hypothetical protein